MDIIDDKLTFIISNCNKCCDYKQAYIVASSKGSYENAVRWAKGYYNKNDNTYEEYTTENRDFELSILESANGSSQGGKLSFWNCLVRKDGKEFTVGVTSNSLCELLKKTTWINGVCQESISFNRTQNVDVIRTCDIKQTTATLTKKTTKLEIGKTYGTKKTEGICAGEIYVPVQEDWVGKDWKYNNKVFDINFNKTEKIELTSFDNRYEYLQYYKKCYPSRYELPKPQVSKEEIQSRVQVILDEHIKDIAKYFDSYSYHPSYSILDNFDGIPNHIDELIEYYKKVLDHKINVDKKKYTGKDGNSYTINFTDKEGNLETYNYDNSFDAIIKVVEIIISELERIKKEDK